MVHNGILMDNIRIYVMVSIGLLFFFFLAGYSSDRFKSSGVLVSKQSLE